MEALNYVHQNKWPSFSRQKLSLFYTWIIATQRQLTHHICIVGNGLYHRQGLLLCCRVCGNRLVAGKGNKEDATYHCRDSVLTTSLHAVGFFILYKLCLVADTYFIATWSEGVLNEEKLVFIKTFLGVVRYSSHLFNVPNHLILSTCIVPKKIVWNEMLCKDNTFKMWKCYMHAGTIYIQTIWTMHYT